MIGHVNNVKYIEWVLNTDDLVLQNKFNVLEVNYLNETGPSEQLQIIKNTNSKNHLFSIVSMGPGKEACRIRLTWD